MKSILILCGGQSPEHEISIRSARNIWKTLDKTKYDITCVGISKTGRWQLIESLEDITKITIQGSVVWINPGQSDPFISVNKNLGNIDVVIPVLHGPNGEDGSVQGLLQLLKIPFVGTGVLSSAVAMDKDVAKRLLRGAGLKVADWKLLRKGDPIPDYESISNDLGNVVFVKPANMGSSVGVSKVTNEQEWKKAVKEAFNYDIKLLIESQIIGRELECAVLGNEEIKTTGVGEVDTGEFYSYDEKYANDSTASIVIPAKIDAKFLPHLREVAKMSYQALNCEGLSRVDMFLCEDGQIFVNEVNTFPGFTSISMYPKLWEEEGLSYSKLLDQLIDLAVSKHTT